MELEKGGYSVRGPIDELRTLSESDSPLVSLNARHHLRQIATGVLKYVNQPVKSDSLLPTMSTQLREISGSIGSMTRAMADMVDAINDFDQQPQQVSNQAEAEQTSVNSFNSLKDNAHLNFEDYYYRSCRSFAALLVAGSWDEYRVANGNFALHRSGYLIDRIYQPVLGLIDNDSRQVEIAKPQSDNLPPEYTRLSALSTILTLFETQQSLIFSKEE